jgi:hypothetical protein
MLQLGTVLLFGPQLVSAGTASQCFTQQQVITQVMVHLRLTVLVHWSMYRHLEQLTVQQRNWFG